MGCSPEIHETTLPSSFRPITRVRRSHIACMISEIFSPNRMKLRVANLYWEQMRQSGISNGADLMKLSEDSCGMIFDRDRQWRFIEPRLTHNALITAASFRTITEIFGWKDIWLSTLRGTETQLLSMISRLGNDLDRRRSIEKASW